MPLTINVGLSRKTSENFNSRGVSINLTAELDQALLARPDDLQGAVNELYEQAEYALVRQANSTAYIGANQWAMQPRSNGTNGNSHVHADNDRVSSPSARCMTPSQRNAVFVIADQLGINPIDEARHEFGIDLDRASITEASKLIDHLNSMKVENARVSRQ